MGWALDTPLASSFRWEPNTHFIWTYLVIFPIFPRFSGARSLSHPSPRSHSAKANKNLFSAFKIVTLLSTTLYPSLGGSNKLDFLPAGYNSRHHNNKCTIRFLKKRLCEWTRGGVRGIKIGMYYRAWSSMPQNCSARWWARFDICIYIHQWLKERGGRWERWSMFAYLPANTIFSWRTTRLKGLVIRGVYRNCWFPPARHLITKCTPSVSSCLPLPELAAWTGIMASGSVTPAASPGLSYFVP